jgi:uncharacterized cupin superfamily protein
MSRYTYPHTIDNGAGERITFVRRVPGALGDRLEGENVATPGAGPPMHVHHFLDEVFTVQQGRMGYQRLGEPPGFAVPGQTVAFKAGEPHKFWNAGDDDLHCTGHVEPADNVEYILTEAFASAKRRGGGRPDPFDMAFLATRYRSEYTMVEVPSPVQRLLFPILVFVGRLLGKHERYADAPDPVRR